VERQRVVVIGRRMLRDLVTRLLTDCVDIEVVAAERDTPLTRAVDEAGAAFVIVGNGDAELGKACTTLLDERPHVRALAIVDEGRNGFLFEMRPHRIPLGELSPEALVSAMRTTARRGGRR
jgi:hypothetical protein